MPKSKPIQQETKETELKIIQSTETFQRSNRLNNWDQTGQKWQSEQPKATSKSAPKPEESQTKPLSLQAVEPKKSEQTDLRGKDTEAVSFKRQPQHDTFNGTSVVVKKAKPLDTVKTVGTAIFGLCCLGIGVLGKHRAF